MTEPEIGTGKTVFVIAVVLGCFAVLYPKIFYHMMFDKERNNEKTDPLRPGKGIPSTCLHNNFWVTYLHNQKKEGKKNLDFY